MTVEAMETEARTYWAASKTYLALKRRRADRLASDAADDLAAIASHTDWRRLRQFCRTTLAYRFPARPTA